MNTELVDAEQLQALEECELKINNAWHKGIEASFVIGRELEKIRNQELFRALGFESFHAYVKERQDPRSMRRQIAVLGTVQALKAANLPLPANESQVVELARLDDEIQPLVWQRLLTLRDKDPEKPITVDRVRAAVEFELAAKPARAGVKTTLDLAGNGAADTSTIRLSADGERALNRIRRLCGDPIADSIVRLNIVISERDLIKWSEQDDATVKQLAYYIAQRWSVTKALAFENRDLNGMTTINDMIALAYARGGTLELKYAKAKIIVEMSA